MLNAPDATSTRPYLLRAMHEWCTDSGFTPYVAVFVDETVQVPMEYVKNGEIVLNVGYDATAGMTLGNEFIEFKARFGGKPREIMVPMNRVMAIYARENGQGMSFPVNRAERVLGSPAEGAASSAELAHPSALTAVPKAQDPEGLHPTPSAPRPMLTRIK